MAFCQSLFGAETRWVQTSYNGNFRGKYAGIGDTYDAEKNEFIAPVVEAPVVEAAPVASIEAPTVQVTDTVQTLSSADIPALTTTDISSLG